MADITRLILETLDNLPVFEVQEPEPLDPQAFGEFSILDDDIDAWAERLEAVICEEREPYPILDASDRR